MADERKSRIVYLDQNKWIELLRAEQFPGDHPSQFTVLQRLRANVEAREIVLPLTATNIYETYKICDPDRRRRLAMLQASLSGGRVFCGRYRRLEAELLAFLSTTCNVQPKPQGKWWFLSDIYIEAFADIDDGRTKLPISDRLLAFIRRHPATALYDYLTTAPDEIRAFAVKAWSDGSEALRARIETRQERHRSESLAMRRRIYNVLMFSDEVELLSQLARKHGVFWNSVSDIGSSLVRRLVEEMPIYYTERELALRLEAQSRPINENDFRDVKAYCAAIPYADEVIGENLLINVARQASLGERYNTLLKTDILSLAA